MSIRLTFPRDYYLECAEQFENNIVDDVEQELSEFNGDPEDLAYELAYTRYALAKKEAELNALRAENERIKFALMLLKERHPLNDWLAGFVDTVLNAEKEAG